MAQAPLVAHARDPPEPPRLQGATGRGNRARRSRLRRSLEPSLRLHGLPTHGQRLTEPGATYRLKEAFYAIPSIKTQVMNIMTTQQEVAAFIAAEFPQTKCVVREISPGGATVFHEVGPSELRPGGTVSGPVLMGVADVALYVAILGRIGIVPLAVTTSLTINFLRKPAADRGIIGVCKLLKTGRSLVVGEVSLYSEGTTEPVAHVVGTYSIPPDARSQTGSEAWGALDAQPSTRG